MTGMRIKFVSVDANLVVMAVMDVMVAEEKMGARDRLVAMGAMVPWDAKDRGDAMVTLVPLALWALWALMDLQVLWVLWALMDLQVLWALRA